MKIGFIILNYINYPDTIRCVDSIIKCAASEKQINNQCVIMIIDNDSPNNSKEMIENHIKKIPVPRWISMVLTTTEKNLGFGGGNNVGLKILFDNHSCDCVFLINNDTIVHGLSIQKLSRKLNRHDYDIVGGYIFERTMNRRHMNGGAVFDKFFFVSKNIKDISRLKKAKRQIFYLSGAFMGVNKSVYKKVGQLEESYFLYFEELDWIYRAEKKLNRKLRICIDPDIKILHKVGGITGNTKFKSGKGRIVEYYSARARILFAKKMLPNYTFNAIVYNIILLLHRLIMGHWENVVTIFKATCDGLKGVCGIQDRVHYN